MRQIENKLERIKDIKLIINNTGFFFILFQTTQNIKDSFSVRMIYEVCDWKMNL